MERAYATQDIWVENEGRRIYGVAHLPKAAAADRLPLVIFAHELGVDHASGARYAKALASAGYAVYSFDFCGGSAFPNRSDGTSLEMSVMTEAADVAAVVEAARTWSFVDPDKIVLLGGSQGGCASTIYATEHADKIAALALLYPGLHIPDAVRQLFGSLDEVPATYGLLGDFITVGRAYAEDVWDYDLFAHLDSISVPALIVHGSEDAVVPLAYSRRAAALIPNCELKVIEGAGHGFARAEADVAAGYVLDFLRRVV